MEKKGMPIDTALIKARIKELGYTYKKIEEISEGQITESSLKHFLNKGSKIDANTLDVLADLLEVNNKNDFIDKDYLFSINLPFEVNAIVRNLYLRNKEDINRYYAEKIKDFRMQADLRTMLNEAHRLFLVLSSEDFIFDKTAFVKAFNIIGTEFIQENCIANMRLTGIQDTVANNLYSKIINASGEYNTQQVILMFLYVFILFDGIFLEEALASATQLVPERKTEKAEQYFEITYRNERMRNTLINLLLYKGYDFDTSRIIEFGIDDVVIEGIVLMLTACEKCFKHLNGYYVNSEYLNRADFDAILTKLEKVFETLDIELPVNNILTDYVNMNTSRFGINYNMLKTAFNSLNPPNKPKNKELEGFYAGMWINKFFENMFNDGKLS